MSNHKENDIKQRRHDHLLKNLPTEVLLKARSTLVSLGGALKPRHDQQRTKESKQEAKSKKSLERLKNSRSEPEFGEMRKKHKSRIEDVPREYVAIRPRPLSVGATKRYEDDLDFKCRSFSKDMSPLHRQYDSTDEVCVQSRLVIPVTEKLGYDVQEANERPRKKLSFREPEIVSGGSATLGRSNKLMGVNSLSKRPNRLSLRSSMECLDSDLESQAMRIVRTVGQAFEVCHKMNLTSPGHPAPSTSSAVGEPVASSSGAASKAPASDCGASESGGASTSNAAEEVAQSVKPAFSDLLPPPPRKENSKRPQHTTPLPKINLPEIPDVPELSADLPECVTKVDLSPETDSAVSTQHQVKLLRERLEQQAQQTRAAVAQLLLVRNQLAVEQTARCEAQARTHQLLVHNRELIDHIAALIGRLHDDGIGVSRPVSAQHHMILPQTDAAGGKGEKKNNNIQSSNGNLQTAESDDLISFFTAENSSNNHNKFSESFENNNKVKTSTTMNSIPNITTNGSNPTLNFTGMTNEEIQEYLISKFQDMGVNGPEPDPVTHKQFYQNSNAFPNFAPLTSHFSSTDLASLLNHKAYQGKFESTEALVASSQKMSVSQSQQSLSSDSSSDSSPDLSSDDGVPYIMPLSHNATLTATGDDGRIRLIVPVSPSESTSDVQEVQPEPSTSKATNGNTLRVPEPAVASSSSITRTTSEKLSSSAKIDRWFSLLQTTPALSRPESGFVSGVEEGEATLADTRNVLLQLGVKKKRRILPLRFKRRVLANKHTML